MLLAAFSLVACAPTEPPVDLPQVWAASDGNGSTIELDADGSGRFADVPLAIAGADCSRDNVELFTGDVSWRGGGEFSYLIDAAGREVVLWVDAGPMQSVNWQKVSLAFCGEETPWDVVLDYGAS